jgi:hypothetical protein
VCRRGPHCNIEGGAVAVFATIRTVGAISCRFAVPQHCAPGARPDGIVMRDKALDLDAPGQQAVPARDQQGASMRDPPLAATAGVNLLSFIQAVSPQAPPAAATTPVPTGTSATVAPAGELQAVAPLSQPVATTLVGTGAASAAASPYFSSSAPAIPGEEGAAPTSPSVAAPSTPGGGGGTLEDCMRFWDRATHMSKVEWRAACQRSQHRLDAAVRELTQKPTPVKPGTNPGQ